MKFERIDDTSFLLKVNSSYMTLDDGNLYDNIKKLLIHVRKKYHYDIYGFYNVDIYYVKNFLTIILFNKKDTDLFNNTIDLKITKHLKELSIKLEDYYLTYDYLKYLNKGLIKGSYIDNKDIIKLSEFYSVELVNLQ